MNTVELTESWRYWSIYRRQSFTTMELSTLVIEQLFEHVS